MKTIFLDIDGVICPYPEYQYTWQANQNSTLSAPACTLLAKIVRETGAKIVLTSSWRLSPQDLKNFYTQIEPFNLREHVAGQTPDLSAEPDTKGHVECRIREIRAYLTAHPTEKYIILDDFNLDRHDKDHTVKTKMHIGLTPRLADVCIAKLKN